MVCSNEFLFEYCSTLSQRSSKSQIPKHSLPKGRPGSEIVTFNSRPNTVQHVETEVQVSFVHPEQFQPPAKIGNVNYQVFNKASLSTRRLYEQIILIVRVRRRSDVLGRDRRGWDTLGHLLHSWDLQLRKLRRVRHHDPRLLIQRAQGQMMLVDFVDVVVVNRGGIFVLVQRQMVVVVVRVVVVGLMAAVDVQS